MAKIVSHLPLTYMWFLKHLCGNPKTVLDLGCGDGELMQTIVDKKWKITGVDIYDKSLKKAKAKGIYEELIKGDLVKTCEKLAKDKKKFDLVFCSQVIEHISRKEGEKILGLAEKLSKDKIYFGTPRGFMNQPEEFIKGNPYQYHKSGWTIEDFKKRGYKVYGIGFYPSWRENGLARSSKKAFAFLGVIVSYLFSALTIFFPSFAAGIMAIKQK